MVPLLLPVALGYDVHPVHLGIIFLANMQKDGSYSIIPRIPGGEITPDMLMRSGEAGPRDARRWGRRSR